MKTNLQAKEAQKNKKGADRIADSQTIPYYGSSTIPFVSPDYSGMHAQVFKIADPVSFDELKGFYGLM